LFWVADLSASLKALIYFGCHAKSSFSQRKTIKQRNNKRLKNKNKKALLYPSVFWEEKKFRPFEFYKNLDSFKRVGLWDPHLLQTSAIDTLDCPGSVGSTIGILFLKKMDKKFL